MLQEHITVYTHVPEQLCHLCTHGVISTGDWLLVFVTTVIGCWPPSCVPVNMFGQADLTHCLFKRVGEAASRREAQIANAVLWSSTDLMPRDIPPPCIIPL